MTIGLREWKAWVFYDEGPPTAYRGGQNTDIYRSEQSYTATCPSGYVGASVTRTAVATSTVSQEAADAKALALATAAASAALSCAPEPPPSCCLYPASGLGTLYTEDDLPASLNYSWVDGVGDPYGPVTLTRSGSSFSGSGITIYLDAGQWIHDTPVNPGGFDCLIASSGTGPNSDEINDNFPAELEEETFTGAMERDGLCQWIYQSLVCSSGDDYFYNTRRVYYDPGDCKWHLEIINWEDCYLLFESFNAVKTGDQSTPIGTYYSAEAALYFTVS